MLASLAKTLLLFALAGPLFGLAWFLIQYPSATHGDWDFLVFISYILGAVPALVTGMAAWIHGRNLGGRYSGALLCGIVGALTTGAFWLAVLQRTSDALPGLLAGGFAGLICGSIYFWFPGNFFRPDSLRRLP